MTAVSEYILEVSPKQDTFKDKKLGFQMNYDVTYRKEFTKDSPQTTVSVFFNLCTTSHVFILFSLGALKNIGNDGTLIMNLAESMGFKAGAFIMVGINMMLAMFLCLVLPTVVSVGLVVLSKTDLTLLVFIYSLI